MKEDVHDLSENTPTTCRQEPKRAWHKPEIRTLTVAFTLTGGGHSNQTREEDADNPSTNGYSPDS